MVKTLILSRKRKIACLSEKNKIITDLIIEKGSHQIGDIYMGLVTKILPSINAAFVVLDSSQTNGFIHINNLGHLRRNNKSININHHLFSSSVVMVQVLKASNRTKGPTVTGRIALKGRYLTLLPFEEGISFSQSFNDQEEVTYLKLILSLIKPKRVRVLVDRIASYSNLENVIQEFYYLLYQWDHICKNIGSNLPPFFISSNENFISKVLQKVYTEKINAIVVDSFNDSKKIASLVSRWKEKENLILSIKYFSRYDFFIRNYNLDLLVYELLQPRINLYGGAYIVIEKTEALTTIDVNSGSFNYLNSPRETILLVNKRAAKQISRHVKLRNISGVIIVDFIDMIYQQDQLELLVYFDFVLKQDAGKPKIVQFSELGLVEFTRKRQSKTLSENFFVNSDLLSSFDCISYQLSSCSLGHTLFLESNTLYSL